VVRFIGIEADVAVQRLAVLGVELVKAGGDDAAVVERALPDGERQVRSDVVIEPPADDTAGMAAWHVNSLDEAHSVRSGEGLVQFWTDAGPVSAVLEAGDVMVVRGAEHRYLPLTTQRWLIRHAGGPTQEQATRDTGRAAQPWPSSD
jgi:hypothetical protein